MTPLPATAILGECRRSHQYGAKSERKHWSQHGYTLEHESTVREVTLVPIASILHLTTGRAHPCNRICNRLLSTKPMQYTVTGRVGPGPL
jgi:hypothetical protein